MHYGDDEDLTRKITVLALPFPDPLLASTIYSQLAIQASLSLLRAFRVGHMDHASPAGSHADSEYESDADADADADAEAGPCRRCSGCLTPTTAALCSSKTWQVSARLSVMPILSARRL
eukprot:2676132-Rhodomonas_salina.1